MDEEELGKAPKLDPLMDDGAVAAPLPRPPVVGRVVAAAEPPPRPRERAISIEPPPRPRERAVGTEKPPRPKVWAGVAAAAASKADGVELFFFLAAAGGDIAPKSKTSRVGGGEVEMDLGKTTPRYIEVEMDFGAQNSRARPNRLLPCACPLLTTPDPSTPSTLKDEAVQRCCGVSSASEHGTQPSPRETTGRSSLGGVKVVFVKMSSPRRGKRRRCTCP